MESGCATAPKRRRRTQPPPSPPTAPPKRNNSEPDNNFHSAIIVLLALITMSGGVMVWLSIAATGELNRPQETRLSTADWISKVCARAIAGFASGLRLANGKTAPPAH